MGPPRLIGLVGKARAGKDTVAEYLGVHYGFTNMKFANPLKDMVARTFNLPRESMEDAKEVVQPQWNNRTIREIQQIIGTEGYRAVDPDYWVKIAESRYHMFNRSADYVTPKVVFSDCRYLNEAAMIAGNGGEVWRIRCSTDPLVPAMHVSEVEQDAIECDHTISVPRGELSMLYMMVSRLYHAANAHD